MKVKKIITSLLLVTSLFAMVSCGKDNKDEAKENDTLKIGLMPAVDTAPILIAEKNGYFKELGLDVEIIQPNEGSSLQLVASGQGDFGVSYQEDLTYARTSDSPLPVKAIAAIIQHNTSGFTSPASKEIKSVKDFEGKVYGGWGGPSENAILQAVMENNGADYSKLNPVTSGADDFFV